jgi:hypothetical protein
MATMMTATRMKATMMTLPLLVMKTVAMIVLNTPEAARRRQ